MTVTILHGDCREVLRTLPDESVHCCVTSPPYWGLRDYGTGKTGIGLEETLDEHIDSLVELFGQVRRVLRKDGTVWLNYGDAYAGSWGAQGRGDKRSEIDAREMHGRQIAAHPKRRQTGSLARTGGCKAKDLMGLPWMLAFALRADGWYLRQDIVWHKPNPMPESITDRCTKAHEYIFLLAKSERYYYDADAIRTPFSSETKAQSFDTMAYKARDRYKKPDGWDTGKGSHGTVHRSGREKGAIAPVDYVPPVGANKRSVWTVATEAFPGAHFATFPPALIEPCILAGCPEGGTVLDPFGGAGTTGMVADRLQRDAILIELNPEYAAIAERRLKSDGGMLSTITIG